jgi:hypothetical protein
MVTIADVKAIAGESLTASANDSIIQNSINFAELYVGTHSPLSMRASGGDFRQFVSIDLFYRDFWLDCRTDDIDIQSVIGYDYEGTAATVDVTDCYALGGNHFKLKSTVQYQKIKVVYKSNYLSFGIDEIVKEVALWKYIRLPIKTGSYNKKVTSAGGQVSQSFVTEKEFYDNINEMLDRLFIRGL